MIITIISRMSHQNIEVQIKSTQAKINVSYDLLKDHKSGLNLTDEPGQVENTVNNTYEKNVCSTGLVTETFVNDIFQHAKDCIIALDEEAGEDLVFDFNDKRHNPSRNSLKGAPFGMYYKLYKPSKFVKGAVALSAPGPRKSKIVPASAWELEQKPEDPFIEVRFASEPRGPPGNVKNTIVYSKVNLPSKSPYSGGERAEYQTIYSFGIKYSKTPFSIEPDEPNLNGVKPTNLPKSVKLATFLSGVNGSALTLDAVKAANDAIANLDDGNNNNVKSIGNNSTHKSVNDTAMNNAAQKAANDALQKELDEAAKKAANYAAQKAANYEALKAANNAAQKAINDAAKQANNDAKKAANYAAQKAANYSAQKAANNAAQKAANYSAQKAANNATRKAANNAAQKAANNAAQKAANNAAQKAANNAAQKAANNASRKAANNAAQKAANNASRKAANNAAQKAENNAAQTAANNAAQKAANTAAQTAANNAAQKAANNAAQKAANNASRKAANNAAQTAANNAAQKAANNAAQKAANNAAQKAANNATRKAAQKAANNNTKKASQQETRAQQRARWEKIANAKIAEEKSGFVKKRVNEINTKVANQKKAAKALNINRTTKSMKNHAERIRKSRGVNQAKGFWKPNNTRKVK